MVETGGAFFRRNGPGVIAIGDMLIERYIEQKEALEAGDRAHAIALQFEIKELMREKEKVAKSGYLIL